MSEFADRHESLSMLLTEFVPRYIYASNMQIMYLLGFSITTKLYSVHNMCAQSKHVYLLYCFEVQSL